MKFAYHPEALGEYEASVQYYLQRDPAVAERFVAAIDDAIGRVLASPTRWRAIEQDVRRCHCHVFPYGILYTVEPDFVLIVAVMHCSREPNYWKSRTATPDSY